jgi:hypothetical protein
MAASQTYLTAPKLHGAPTLSDQLNLYLALDHRDNLAGGCAMAASASEIARQDEAVSARLAEGFEQMAGSVQAAVKPTTLSADDRARALTIAAAMIGGVAMARAAAKSRPDLSDEIMAAVRRVLGEVGGEGGEPRGTEVVSPRQRGTAEGLPQIAGAPPTSDLPGKERGPTHFPQSLRPSIELLALRHALHLDCRVAAGASECLYCPSSRLNKVCSCRSDATRRGAPRAPVSAVW